MNDKHQSPDTPQPESGQPESGPSEAGSPQPGPATPDLGAARRQLREAREQLRLAEECYAQLKRKTVAKVTELRESSCGENLDRGLNLVRKHPGLSVICALAAGFFVGGLFRRR